MTILINEVEKAIEINPQEVWDTFQITQKKLVQSKGRKQVIEVNLSILVERDKNKNWDNWIHLPKFYPNHPNFTQIRIVKNLTIIKCH
jgi:hypothetical protein